MDAWESEGLGTWGMWACGHVGLDAWGPAELGTLELGLSNMLSVWVLEYISSPL